MASEFVERGLKKLRVVGVGRTMTAEQAVDGLAILNSMLALWSADDLLIPYRTASDVTLTAGVNPHTIGPSGTINTAQPMDIHGLAVVTGGLTYQLDPMPLNVYQALPDPSIQSIPSQFYFERGEIVGRLYFDFAPAEAYAAKLTTLKRLTTFAALTDNDDVPDEYEVPIVFNFACHAASDWGKEVTAMTAQIAKDSLALLRRNASASRVPRLEFPPELRTGRGRFNIDSYE